MKRRTVVCRNLKPGHVMKKPGDTPPMCNAGGWWGDAVPDRCPRCNGKLTELAPTYVTPVRL